MRYLSTLFVAALCACAMCVCAFTPVVAQEVAPSPFSVDVMAGATLNDLDLSTDSLGYSGGLKVCVSDRICLLTFYDYVPTGKMKAGDKVYESTVALYGGLTLFNWKSIAFSGLLGAEWESGRFADFLDGSPAMAGGLMGEVSLSKKFGAFGVLTIPTDALDDFDNFQVRGGASLGLF